MTDFLIKSTISMLAFLAIYYLFLEREKMHTFNRFYLLFALVFSLAMPFITFTIYKEVAAEPQPVFTEGINFTAPVTAVAAEPVAYTTPALWALYGLITLVLILKFVKNIHHFTKKARKNQSQKLENATLILLEEKVIPHTFLNYIFVSKDDYNHNSIEEELYTHELAHVKQKHSIDILFIEVLKTVLWFNPLLYFYKKAIQLNHEFMADETVVFHSNNVITYQQLLLQKAVPATAYQLASSLNFSVTKKRLTMMTKDTTKRKALWLKLAAVPVVAGLVYALCTQVVAQTTAAEALPSNATYKPLSEKDAARDWYYDGVTVRVLDSNKVKIVHKPYKDLTKAEKDTYLPPLPGPLQKTPPTKKQFEDLKNAVNSTVSIDFEDVHHKDILKYKAADFAIYIADLSITGKPQRNHFMLITNSFYNKNFRDKHETFEYNTYTSIMLKDEKTGKLKPEMVPNEIGATKFLENRAKVKAANALKNDSVGKLRKSK